MEVILPINIPLYLVTITLRGERLKTVGGGYLGSLLIGSLLVVFIVPVVWVD